MMHWGDFGWGMGFGWIWMVLFWVAVLSVIVYAVRSASSHAGGHHEKESPLDILKIRYAKGEITKDEYDRMKDDLSKS